MNVLSQQNYSDMWVSCSKIGSMDYKGFSSDDEKTWKLTPDSHWLRITKYALAGAFLCGLLAIIARLSK